MKKAFELFMADEGENHSEAWAKLKMPASPYEIMDALEKAEIREDRPVFLEVQKYAPELEALKPYMETGREVPDLYAFNALAKKLVTLDAVQRRAFMERLLTEPDNGSIPISRLYYLIAGGKAFQNLNLTPVNPDYTILLELKPTKKESAVMLKLPAVMDAPELEMYQKIPFRCADCRIPALTDAITGMKNIARVNKTARILEAVPETELRRYKALLEAKGFTSLKDALNLYKHLDEYALEPDIHCVEDIAKKELRSILSQPAAEKLIPHVSLFTYGKVIMQEYHMSLTGYGGLCRKDGKPFRKDKTAPEESCP